MVRVAYRRRDEGRQRRVRTAWDNIDGEKKIAVGYRYTVRHIAGKTPNTFTNELWRSRAAFFFQIRSI